MIDYTAFKIANFSNTEFEKLTELVDVDCPIDSKKVFFDLKNLRISYYADSKQLYIKNSLHKFYNADLGLMQLTENYNDFKLQDMIAVASVFSELYFNRPIQDFELSTKLEIGVNLEVSGHRPFDIIDRYLAYQVINTSNSFVTCEPRGDKGKPIMRKCYLSDYQLKFYDKSKQAKLSFRNILRYEVVFNQLRKIRAVLGIKHLTMQTLCEADTWNKFGAYLLKVYDDIRKLPIIEDASIKLSEINQIHGHCSKYLKDDLKSALVKSEYNKVRLKNEDVYDYWNDNPFNLHVQIRKQLTSKIYQLTKGPVS